MNRREAKRTTLGSPPGIKIRTGRDGVIRLTDAKTGRWLANIRWRPCGTVFVQLAENVRKAVATADASNAAELAPPDPDSNPSDP